MSMYYTVTVVPEITGMIEAVAEAVTPVRTYVEPVEYYEGEYEFTPSAPPQIIPVKDKMARHDITINPIPSNYGLITWDGSTITVS